MLTCCVAAHWRQTWADEDPPIREQVLASYKMVWIPRSSHSSLRFPKVGNRYSEEREIATGNYCCVGLEVSGPCSESCFCFLKTARQERCQRCAWADTAWCTSHSTQTQCLFYASSLAYCVEAAVWACRRTELCGCLGQYPLHLHELWWQCMHLHACLIHNQPCSW